jgi:DNA-binding MltR family transcriptional regulator
MARKVITAEDLHKESVHLWEVLRAESPLAATLICGAFLDKALAALLMKFFVKGQTAHNILDENKGAISDFFKRANLAYCLGLITSMMLQNLLLIAQIRNVFAHSHKTMDFSHPDVAELCAKLQVPKVAEQIALGGPPTPLSELLGEPSTRFRIISLLTFNSLINIAMSTEHRTRPTSQPMWTKD